MGGNQSQQFYLLLPEIFMFYCILVTHTWCNWTVTKLVDVKMAVLYFLLVHLFIFY